MNLLKVTPYYPEKKIENKSSREITDPREDVVFNGPCPPIGLYVYLCTCSYTDTIEETTCPYEGEHVETSQTYPVQAISSLEMKFKVLDSQRDLKAGILDSELGIGFSLKDPVREIVVRYSNTNLDVHLHPTFTVIDPVREVVVKYSHTFMGSDSGQVGDTDDPLSGKIGVAFSLLDPKRELHANYVQNTYSTEVQPSFAVGDVIRRVE